MTKEQLEKEVERLESQLRNEQKKVDTIYNDTFYVGQVERCRLYDEIFNFIKCYLDKGGEIILRPRNADTRGEK